MRVLIRPMTINYKKTGGSFFSASKLHFSAANAFAPGVTLFTVSGDGESNCAIETMANSDPVSTLLAAYAISCKARGPPPPRARDLCDRTPCAQPAAPPRISRLAPLACLT